MACRVIEIEAEEWYAALCECIVERIGTALGRAVYIERKYNAIPEV